MTAVSPIPANPAPRRALGRLSIVSGSVAQPDRIYVYGPPGVGKTTLAVHAPRPLLLCAEDGAVDLDVARVNFELDAAKPARFAPASWDEVISALDAVIAEDVSMFETLVIDGMEVLDQLAHDQVLRSSDKKWRTIQEYAGGYGKGEAASLDLWRGLLRRLDDIRTKRRLRIVLVGHSTVKTTKNPEGASYDRYLPAVTSQAQGDVAGLLVSWVEILAFARFETFTTSQDGKVVGVVSGRRLLHLHRAAAYEAKCRHRGVPSTIELPASEPWAAIERAIAEGKQPRRLREEAQRLLEGLDADTRAKAETWLATVGDNTAALAEGIDRLRARAAAKEVSS